jgi:hypothetical protein
MGLFKRKPAELDQLRARKSLLEKQSLIAERELAAAIEARQQVLVEGDPVEQPNERPDLVARLRDEVEAVRNAIATVDQRIVEAEGRLAEEQDSRRRGVASRELTASADALDHAADAVADALARVFPALDDVLSKLPLPHLVQKANLKVFSDAVVESLRAQASEAKAYTVRLTSGDAALVTPRPDDVKTAAAPIVERQQVFILAPSKWVEPSGEVITVGTHCTASPPAEIAKLALQHGHAIEAGSDLAVTLQMRQPPNYSHFSEFDCTDISQPKQLTKPPGAPTAALPPIHSEFVGRPRVGTARIARA